MTLSAAQALQNAQLFTDERTYRMLKLPTYSGGRAFAVLSAQADPFCAVLVDKDETSIFLSETVYTALRESLPAHELSDAYRLITFDLELEPTLTGFMALISRALADAGVPILPLAAYSRDHLLVPAAQIETALTCLRALQSGTGRG